MKKIFAIALALVMVLSMASAFAAANLPGSCSWGTWDCTTYTAKCGVAKAEVVKFVRTNDCDPFVQSDCAAVVKGLPVYYAVKVVFEENVNEQWFMHDATKLTVAVKNMTIVSAPADKKLKEMATYADVKKGGTFWVTKSGTLVKDADFATDACVFEGTATSTGVKVCADVEYVWNGKGLLVAADGKGYPVDFGKYTAYYNDVKSQIIVTDKSTGDVAAFGIAGGVVKTIETGSKAYNAYYNGKFYGVDIAKLGAIDASSTMADVYAVLGTDGDTCSYLPGMMQFLGLEFGTCVTDDGIKAFFGWDDDNAFEFCATWDKNAQGVVNAECVVAIPKTGDASVLAWLF